MTRATVRLTTDPIELARVDELLGVNDFRNSNRTVIVSNLVSGSLCLVIVMIQILFPSRATFSRNAAFYLYLAIAILNFAQAGFAIRRSRPRDTAYAVDSDVTISDAGLTSLPSGRTFPWTAIVEVRKVDAYLAFVGPHHVARAIVAGSDLPNDGRDLWALLDDRFVPKRYLIRDALSSARISIGAAATRARVR